MQHHICVCFGRVCPLKIKFQNFNPFVIVECYLYEAVKPSLELPKLKIFLNYLNFNKLMEPLMNYLNFKNLKFLVPYSYVASYSQMTAASDCPHFFLHPRCFV